MPFWFDNSWVLSFLNASGKGFRAYRKSGGAFSDDYPILMELLEDAVLEGGALFRHEHDWEVIERVIDPFGNEGFKLKPTRTDIWYIPECSFEELLCFMGIFGFPSKEISPAPQVARESCTALLRKLCKVRPITIISFASRSLHAQLLDAPFLTVTEFEELREFNEIYFGTKLTDYEAADLRSVYRRTQSFIVG